MATEISSRLEFVSLPEVVAEKIASFLDGTDLINLGYTCRFWNRIASTDHVWKNLVIRRFGKQEQGTGNEDGSNVGYKLFYMKLSSSKKPATDFYVLHLFNRANENSEYYLEKVQDPDSKYGEVIKLNTVCWLQINSHYKSVIPGKYILIWRMRLDDAYLSCSHVEFRARPEEFHGTEVCKRWKDEDFKEAERKFGSGKWFEADMGEFEVTSMCDVYVEVTGRIDWWCGGMSWDYAELRPAVNKRKQEDVRNVEKKNGCIIS